MSAESNHIEFLLWQLGSELFALELSYCREIVRDVPITPLPRAPHFVCGLANLRGTVVAVIDLELLLGLCQKKSLPSKTSLIRPHSTGYPYAVAADKVEDTLRLSTTMLEDLPANFTEEHKHYVRKVAKTPAGLVLIPYIERIGEKIA